MAKKKRICVFIDEQIYNALQIVAEYNAYNDLSELVRAVLRQFLVELKRNGVVVLPAAAVPPRMFNQPMKDEQK